MESLFFSLVDFMKELNYEKKLVSVQTLVTYSCVTFSQSQHVCYTNYVVIVLLLQELYWSDIPELMIQWTLQSKQSAALFVLSSL